MGTWNHSSHRELSKAITSGGKNKQLIESEVYSEEFHDSSINTNEENEATFNNSQQKKTSHPTKPYFSGNSAKILYISFLNIEMNI